MLKRLGEVGLIEHHPYRGRAVDRRRGATFAARGDPPPTGLLELFLAEFAADGRGDRVHAEAEVLEHVISEDPSSS